MPTIAIGDVHGHLAALDDLLIRLAPELGVDDEIVFLGDYVDDGPHVAACIDRILSLRAEGYTVVALMGNHEEWMLESYRDHARHSWVLGMAGLTTMASYAPDVAEAIATEMEEVGQRLVLDRVEIDYGRFFRALPQAHLEFFTSLPVFHRTPHVLCVHGGFDPALGPVEAQSPHDLIWGPAGFPFRYAGAETVVYGHHNDAVVDASGWPRPRIVGRTFGIDTIRHGVLTAMRFPDLTIFQSGRHDPLPG